jgi:methionine-rich copper-binding protein CopC
MVWRGVGAVAALTVALLAGAQTATAHTDVDFTLPTDGAVVGEPVSEITVAFEDPVTLIGPGFEVLDPQGDISAPFVVTDDDMVFRLQIDPPIGGGDAAVRFEVRAEDGHTISGGFSFTILADAPPTTIAPTTIAPTTTTESVTTEPVTTEPVTTEPVTTEPVTTEPVTTEPVTTEPDTTATSAPAVDISDGGGSSTGLSVAIAAVVAVLAGAFAVTRSRAASA